MKALPQRQAAISHLETADKNNVVESEIDATTCEVLGLRGWNRSSGQASALRGVPI